MCKYQDIEYNASSFKNLQSNDFTRMKYVKSFYILPLHGAHKLMTSFKAVKLSIQNHIQWFFEGYTFRVRMPYEYAKYDTRIFYDS